jgi:hypothetical protein
VGDEALGVNVDITVSEGTLTTSEIQTCMTVTVTRDRMNEVAG